MSASRKVRRPVRIYITNIVRQMDSEEKTETTVAGVFYQDEGSYYLHYEEKELTGIIRTVIKLSDKELLLLRSGAVNMRMHFLKDGKRSTATIHSEAGKLIFESELISCQEIFAEEPVGFLKELAFQYDLLNTGEYIGSYSVLIGIEEESKE
ncbi:DUF1934 domain-containing protein [Listeria sp. PSOL-1]|uniref:DUF1934 domain-containing protein n=1 Tax=Listeria sp. PSOL-1 TaxID=1844999 RepID=UPI0013D838AE|nr:DUF1934 family protein [Listeria sp. PSOL-1]